MGDDSACPTLEAPPEPRDAAPPATDRLLGRLSPLSRTLLLPVAARAFESRRRGGCLHDPAAEAVVAALPSAARPDLDRARRDRLTRAAVVARTVALDRLVATSLRTRPAAVVNLGAGLDTRRRRLAAASGPPWWHVDLEPALRLRRSLLPDGPGERALAGDALDPAWIDAVHADGPLLLVAEGLLPFLPQDDVIALVRTVAARRPGSTLVADVVGPMLVRGPALVRMLRGTGVRFAWAYRTGRDLGAGDDPASPPIRVVDDRPAIDVRAAPWGPVRGLRRLPVVRRTLRFVRMRLGDPGPGGREAGCSPPQR